MARRWWRPADDTNACLWDLRRDDSTRRAWGTGLSLGSLPLVALALLLTWKAYLRRRPTPRRRSKVRFGTYGLLGGAAALLVAAALVWWWPLPVAVFTGQQEVGKVGALAFSPDGQVLAIGRIDNGALQLWGLSGGQLEPRKMLVPSGAPILSLGFSPDGRWLVSGHHLKRPLRVWDLGEGGGTAWSYAGRNTSVPAVAFSPDGKEIVAACSEIDPTNESASKATGDDLRRRLDDDGIRRSRLRRWEWDGATAREQAQDNEATFSEAFYVPDGSRALLTAQFDPRIVTGWDVLGGRFQARRTVPRAPYVAGQGEYRVSPNGQVLVEIGGRHRWVPGTTDSPESTFALTVSLYGLAEGRVNLLEQQRWDFKGPKIEETVSPIQHTFAADSQALALCRGRKEVHLWDLRGGRARKLPTIKAGENEITLVALSRKVAWLAAATTKRTICLWELAGGRPRLRHALAGPAEDVAWLGFSPDGRTLVAGTRSSRFSYWALESPGPRRLVAGRPIGKLTAADRERLGYPAGQAPYVIASYEEGNPRDWFFRVFEGFGGKAPDNPSYRAWLDAFCAWEYRLHATVEDGRVVVSREDRACKRTLLEWSPPGQVKQVAFSADGRHLLVRNANYTIEVVRLSGSGADDRLLRSCNAILQKEPDSVSALVQRAGAHLRAERWRLALEDASRAVRLDPACAEGWWLRGLVWVRRGDPARAIESFTALLKLRPRHARALYRRGLSRAERGDHAGALRDLEAALGLEPALRYLPVEAP
jgi:WD40 repeat protein